MNPFIKKALGSVLSIVITAGVTWLIAQGYLSADEGVQLIAIATSAGLIAAQRVWKKSGDQKELLTAQAMPGPSNNETIKATVKAGLAPPVMTKAGEVPELKPVSAP